MNKSIKVLSLSDLHLGHRQVPTETIIQGLDAAVPDNQTSAEIDLIFLCGDVFDEGLYLHDSNIPLIQMWIVRLLRICKKWDIVLRVLAGTPSHDRGQSQQFITLNEALAIQADIQYIDTLSIECIERFDISVLYVPDEWRACPLQTQQEVITILAERSLAQVDFAVMHGHFEYQLPPMRQSFCHNVEFYLTIVSKYIFIGHIHTPSHHQRIYAQGSLCCLAHNEEHAKGYIIAEVHPGSTENDRIQFKINPYSARFITVDITGLSKLDAEIAFEHIIERVENNNQHYSIPVFIRVKCEKDDKNEDILNSYRRSYQSIKWTVKTSAVRQLDNTSVIPKIYVPAPISENTIPELIKNRLSCMDISNEMITEVLNLLNTLKSI